MAVNIDCLVKIRFSFVKGLILEALRTGKEKVGRAEVNTPHFGRLEIACAFFPERMELGFLLTNENGEEVKQRVKIVEEDSNLRNGSKVYYFLCGWCKCRTLYSDGKGFYPRKVFRHSYQRQRMSHKERAVSPKKEPYRAYGKEYYRGKLTPYGKRLRSFEVYEEKREQAIIKDCIKFLGGKI